MSEFVKVMVPAPVAVPRIAQWIGDAAHWWNQRRSREGALLRLAAKVEREAPALAGQLRGLAMQEAAAASVVAKHACTP